MDRFLGHSRRQAMTTHIRCGKLLVGAEDEPRDNMVIAVDGGIIRSVEPEAKLRPGSDGARVLDYSRQFVLPGLSDIHVHLSYGNSRTQEDIDLFASVEYRALRGMIAAQKALRAGFTSIADPATTGRVSLAIRDAINAGLFVGPRLMSSGRQITSRQGLSDWYPLWIGVPQTAVGVLVTSRDHAIEEIRQQVKDGVDFIKIAMDGDTTNPTSGLIPGFTAEETESMVKEVHRLRKKVIVHARGDEGVLYAARAGVDVIFHASWMSDATLEIVLQQGCMIAPTLTFPTNNVDFSQPGDAAYHSFVDGHREELAAAKISLNKAWRAGVPFLCGTDSGFAVTPYGEWHARELSLFVSFLGMSPAQAIACATRNNARFLKNGDKIGLIEPGRFADLLVVDGNPLEDIDILLDRRRIKDVILNGDPVRLPINDHAVQLPGETSYRMWDDVYTRDLVAELQADRGQKAKQAAE
jgi:imidazolonepropionase-like amidohydrolase